jgi:3-deoxy-D-manno-octulosonic-acid transferase
VHNVLEAAVYGKPVVFGNNYIKYREAIDLVNNGGAKSFSASAELHDILANLFNNVGDYEARCKASKQYVWGNKGASEKVLDYIEINRLLTR